MDDVTLLAVSEDAMAVSSGKEIYQTACFSCHGHRLEGGTGFDLRDGEWIHGGNPSSILNSIAKGFPEKGMVAYETVYDESTLANMVAYILSERVGFQDLRYQVYNAPAEPSSLETLVQGALTGEGSLPNGYTDTSIPGGDTFAIVFNGELIAGFEFDPPMHAENDENRMSTLGSRVDDSAYVSVSGNFACLLLDSPITAPH